MKRKPLKLIVWCVGIVVVLGISGLFMANYTVTKVMDVFASESEVVPPENLQEKNLDPLPPKEVDKTAPSKDNPSAFEGGGGSSTPKLKDKAVEKKNASQSTGAVTDQQVNQVQESLTTVDKAKIISVMTRGLNRSNLQKLWDLAKEGLTVAEKREAKELLLGTLSSDDYNTLSKLAKKYGISKGKAYDEAKRELNL